MVRGATAWAWPDESSLLQSLQSSDSDGGDGGNGEDFFSFLVGSGDSGDSGESSSSSSSSSSSGSSSESDSKSSSPSESGLLLLKSCIERSWWRAAQSLVARAHLSSSHPELVSTWSAEVTSQISELKKNADSFAAYAEETYRGQRQGIKDEVNCALQWAQNSTHVFLGVKYATRWSAPGAIEVVDVNINVTDCCFELVAFGHHSSVRKRYSVSLELFAALAPEASTWSAASVGRSTAILAKKRPDERWSRLTKSKAKSKHQITTWLDMEERWAHDMEKLDERNGKGSKKGKKEGEGKKGDKGKDKKDGDTSKNDTNASSSKAPKKGWKKTAKSIWKKAQKAAKEPRYWFALCGVCTLLWLVLFLVNKREEGKLKKLQEELNRVKTLRAAAAAAADGRASAADGGEEEPPAAASTEE